MWFLANKILQIAEFNVINQLDSQQAQTSFTLKGTLSEVGGDLNFSLKLMNNSSGKLRYSTVLNFPLDDLKQSGPLLVDEIAAILRLFLLHQDDVNNYIGALNPVRYQDIEKLVTVGLHFDSNIPNGLIYAHNTLHALNKQYPNTAEILGLLSFLQMYNCNDDAWTGSTNLTGVFEVDIKTIVKNADIYFTSNNGWGSNSWATDDNTWTHTLSTGTPWLNTGWLKSL